VAKGSICINLPSYPQKQKPNGTTGASFPTNIIPHTFPL
jgi:hypothetical protein